MEVARDAAVADGDCALPEALARFWASQGCEVDLEAHSTSPVAFARAHEASSVSILHSVLRRWMLRVRDALTPPMDKGEGSDQWLVVAIAVAPCSVEESALMLLVAEHRNWVYVPVNASLPLGRQLELLRIARADRVVTLPQFPLARVYSEDYHGSTPRDILAARSLLVASHCEAFETVQVITLERDAESLQAAVVSALPVSNNQDAIQATADVSSPLYVLFTSGSTGEPKGVLGTRAGAWNRIQWMWTRYPFTAGEERVMRTVKLTFVDSVWEILGAFLQRVPLIHVVAPLTVASGSASIEDSYHVVLNERCRFLDHASKHCITRFSAVPSVLEVLLIQKSRHELESAFAPLRYLLISGETLPLKLARQLGDMLPRVTVLNLYGSTEIAGDVTCMALPRSIAPSDMATWSKYGVPIGRIDDVIGACTFIRLVDEADNFTSLPMSKPLSSGNAVAKGELWVSGHPVALGYISSTGGIELLGWRDDESSESECKQNIQCANGRKWFKTGDICAVVRGHLHFCGRRDRLVKIRGLRIQLEAVEREVSRAIVGMGDQQISNKAQVIAWDDDTTTKYGFDHRQLVACIILPSSNLEQHVDIDEKTAGGVFSTCHLKSDICRWIAKTSGFALVPHNVCLISSSAVSRLSNGKLDMRGLASRYSAWRSSSSSVFRQSPDSSSDPVSAFVKTQVKSLFHTNDREFESASSRTLAELGADSLLITLFHFELKQHFPALEIDPDRLAKTTIKNLITSLQNLEHHVEQYCLSQFQVKEGSKDDSIVATRKRKRASRQHESSSSNQGQELCYSLIGLSRSNRLSSGSVFIPTCCSMSSLPKLLSSNVSSKFGETVAMELEWRADLEKCVDASPLVVVAHHGETNASRLAIVGSHAGIVLCVDIEKEGRQVWKARLDDRVEASATLSVRHELVYVGTYAGTLFALDLYSGVTRWKYRCDGMIKSTAVPIDTLGIVVVGAYDHKLHAVMCHDGAVVWTVDVGASVFSSPVFVPDSELPYTLCVTTSGDLISLTCIDTPRRQWEKRLPASVFAGLSVDQSSDLAIVGCADGNVYGIAASSGESRWTVATAKPVFTSPCLYTSCSVVIGSHDGCLRKIDSRSGQVVWSTQLDGAVFSSPFVFRAVLSSSSATDTAMPPQSQETSLDRANDGDDARLLCCAATTVGSVYIIDEQSGKEITCVRSLRALAETEAPSNRLGEIFSSPVVIGRHCLVGTRNNALLGFQLVPGENISGIQREDAAVHRASVV